MLAASSGWLTDQFTKLTRARPDLVEPMLQNAVREDVALRWAVVVGAYMDEQVNLGKAAELLGIHRADLQRQFLDKGIPLRLGPETAEEAAAEVEAWNLWGEARSTE